MPFEGRVVKEGKTVRDAIDKALRSLTIREDQADIEVIDEGRKGILGIGAKHARVRVSIKEEVVAELKLHDILVELEKPSQAKRQGSIETAAAGLALKTEDVLPEKDESAGDSEKLLQETVEDSTAGTVPEDCMGTSSVVDGRLVITDPSGSGRYTCVSVGNNMRLTVNGQNIKGETSLNADDEVILETLDDQPESSFDITVSADGLQAALRLISHPGARYRLKEQPPANRTALQAEVEKIIEPPALTSTDIKAYLEEKGVTKGINEEALQTVIDNPNSRDRYVIAQGQEPVDGVDAQITFPFLQKEDEARDSEQGLFGRERLISVEPGDIVAVKIPKEEGEDGWKVTGEVLTARGAVDCDIQVKNGCEIVDHGANAIATISGRPVIDVGTSQTTLSIDPIYVTDEVNQTTGNIYFSGDVEVKGDVHGCTVEAKGNVEVHGDVSRATISAGASVVLHKMVLGSTVIAGGRSALYSSVRPFLVQINEILKTLTGLARQQRGSSGYQAGEEDDGPLIQSLIDSRFSGLPTVVTNLTSAILGLDQFVHEEILKFAKLLYKHFCGLGMLRMNSIESLEELNRAVGEIIGMIDSSTSKTEYIKVRYVQNCSLISSGDILIDGQGCFISTLQSGGQVIISGKPGIARGVKITSDGNIAIRNVGSEFETATQLKINENGKISAELIHPDVVVQIGQEQIKNDKYAKDFEAYLDNEGKLVVSKLSAEETTK